MKKVLLLILFSLSLYGAKAQQILWSTGVDSVRYELVQRLNNVFRIDKSTGEVRNIWYNNIEVYPLNEPKEDLLDGVVKYRFYYDENNNFYLLNLKTGKVYRSELSSPDKTWNPML